MISSFCLVFRSPPFPKLDFGLWARVFSAVFTHLEPTIPFSHSSAVSPSNHVTSGCMSPRSYFPHWSAVSPTGSSSGHVIALDQSGASIFSIRAPFTTFIIFPSITPSFFYFPLRFELSKVNRTSRKNKTSSKTNPRGCAPGRDGGWGMVTDTTDTWIHENKVQWFYQFGLFCNFRTQRKFLTKEQKLSKSARSWKRKLKRIDGE